MNPNLAKYIAEKNFYGRMLGGRVYNMSSLSPIDVDCLLQDLDNDLSPENLTCDGELRGAPLFARVKMLNGAMKALKKL